MAGPTDDLDARIEAILTMSAEELAALPPIPADVRESLGLPSEQAEDDWLDQMVADGELTDDKPPA